MSFAAPVMLVFLVLVPLAALAYVWLERRRGTRGAVGAARARSEPRPPPVAAAAAHPGDPVPDRPHVPAARDRAAGGEADERQGGLDDRAGRRPVGLDGREGHQADA